MPQDKKSILYISSANPKKGPGTIALDHVHALRSEGYDVDLMTLYPVEDEIGIISVLDKEPGRFSNLFYKLWLRIYRPNVEGHFLFYRTESNPPVRISKVLKKIQKRYDIIIVFYWQKLLSYKTIEKIYDKLDAKPKVIFICADYSPMTGGCHFMGDCQQFENGCHNCCMTDKRIIDKFPEWNMKFRRRVIDKIRPIVCANTYMLRFFKKSYSMQSAKFSCMSIMIDIDKFKPFSNKNLREIYKIPTKKEFIILFGCQSLADPNKGITYLRDALNYLYDIVDSADKEKILLLSIGNKAEEIIKDIQFDHINLGYVNIDKLPEIYNIADVYISPSINDAGPSMVNQSIACGTPVVSFDIGTALDVIKDKNTGRCVPLKNSEAMAKAIFEIYQMSDDQRNLISKRCRDVAIQHHSKEAFIKEFKNALLTE